MAGLSDHLAGRGHVALLLVGFLLVMFGGASLYLNRLLDAPVNVADGQIYVLERGASLTSVTEGLVGIITVPPRVLRYYGLLTRSDGRLQAGEYDLSGATSSKHILEILRAGKVVQREITFLEGWRFAEWRSHLSRESSIVHELADDSEVMVQMGATGASPEGWFFPDTYRFTRGESDVDILRRAHEKMRRVLTVAWPERTVGGVLRTPYEALTVASMIEKETGHGADRSKVAQVFVNRLRKNIRLQSDATVIYGLGPGFNGDLVKRDLREDTPYNTYLHRGLPPTPIAMPGLASIRAALHPEPGEFLYFVARGDGTSEFSKSLAEHADAVERYQRSGRRTDYQSRP